MGIGIIIGVIILIYRLNSNGNQKEGVSGDKPASSNVSLLLCIVLLVLWVGSLAGWFVIVELQKNIPIIAVVIGTYLLLSPHLISLVFSKLGWVKTSYYIGGLSYVVFGRNPYSCALFRGYCAAQKHKTNDEKRQSLQWLKNKFLAHRGKIYSGDMVMATIIDCQLARPDDALYLAAQLKQREGIARASIPKAVSRLAFRCAIGPALANNQWQEVGRIADQWDTPANNRLAKYVKEYCGAYIFKHRMFSKINATYYRLYTLGYPALRCLPKRYKAAGDYDQARANKRYDVDALSQLATVDEQTMATFQSRLLSTSQQQRWQQRAKELGAWQAEDAWQKIEQSVQLCLTQKSGIDQTQNRDEKRLDNIDHQYKNLNYLGHSIARRLHSKELGYGAQNFMDWSKMEAILNDIQSDPSAQISAFQSIENIIWNWVADLWNIRKERCLVHYICVKCGPLANQSGNKELHKLLTGITQGHYS